MSFRRYAVALAVVVAPLLSACGDGSTAPKAPDAPRYITFGFPDVSNTYSNVGAFIVYNPKTDRFSPICSGTLISPTAFLTAAHCTSYFNNVLAPRGYLAYISFDNPLEWGDKSDLAGTTTLIPVTSIVQDPNYTQAQNDVNDLAVLVVDASYTTGITPATLPTLNLLDQLASQGGLLGSTFINSGYGVQERVHETGNGAPQFVDQNPLPRLYSYSTFLALNKGFLRLSQNPSTGNGGTCFGDSGGPIFYSYNGTLYLVAVTVTGDAVCRATNVVYRLDTESAQAFLSQFVSYL